MLQVVLYSLSELGGVVVELVPVPVLVAILLVSTRGVSN